MVGWNWQMNGIRPAVVSTCFALWPGLSRISKLWFLAVIEWSTVSWFTQTMVSPTFKSEGILP